MKHTLLTAALLAACGLAMAKLPPPDEAAKAKAAEAAAKAAWQAKIDAYLLCKAQDRVVARMGGKAATAAGKDAKMVPVKATAPAAAAPPAAAPTAAAPAAAAPAAAAPVAAAPAAAAPAVAASGTPAPNVAVAPTIPPCVEPGPFAYNPPQQKPLETSGAHSPSGTAASPPSVRQPSAEIAPAKK